MPFFARWKATCQSEGGLAGGGVSADDHHVPGAGVELLVQIREAQLEEVGGLAAVPALEEGLESLLEGHPPDAGPLAEEEVCLVDQFPAGVLVLCLIQCGADLPQTPQPGVLLQSIGVGVGIGGGWRYLDVPGHKVAVLPAQGLTDGDGVHRLALAIELGHAAENGPLLRQLEVLLSHRHKHGAHGGLVDEHGTQNAHGSGHEALAEELPLLVLVAAQRYRTPSPRSGWGPSGGPPVPADRSTSVHRRWLSQVEA